MQFNRTALRKAAEAALKADEQAHAAYNQSRVDKHATAKAEWVEQYADAWLAALPKLRDKLRKGRPITPADLPPEKAWRDAPALFRSDAPKPQPYTGGSGLRALIRVLDTIAGDTVSNHALAELGIARDALRGAVRHLGAGEVRA